MSRPLNPLVLLSLSTALALGTTPNDAAGSQKAVDCISLPSCESADAASAEAESKEEEAEFNWKPYAKKMLRKIRRNWIPPAAARKGTPGKAKVRFHIEPEGGLACIDIVGFEGPPEFAAAAQAAVCRSTPFKPFPVASGSPGPEGVTITFLYNMKKHGPGFSFGISSKE